MLTPIPPTEQQFQNIHPVAQLAVVRMLLRAHELSRVAIVVHIDAHPNCSLLNCDRAARHPSGLAWHRWRESHMAILDYMQAGIG